MSEIYPPVDTHAHNRNKCDIIIIFSSHVVMDNICIGENTATDIIIRLKSDNGLLVIGDTSSSHPVIANAGIVMNGITITG